MSDWMRVPVSAVVAAAFGMMACSAALATDTPAGHEKQIGDDTRAWLQLQESGNASLGTVRPMPGEIADRVYDRYVKSFDQPLPDHFQRESVKSSSSSGGN